MDDVNSMVTMGEADGQAAVTGGQEESENTAHYFMLKHGHDERVKGRDYHEFRAMKEAGLFGEESFAEHRAKHARPQKKSNQQAVFLQ